MYFKNLSSNSIASSLHILDQFEIILHNVELLLVDILSQKPLLNLENHPLEQQIYLQHLIRYISISANLNIFSYRMY